MCERQSIKLLAPDCGAGQRPLQRFTRDQICKMSLHINHVWLRTICLFIILYCGDIFFTADFKSMSMSRQSLNPFFFFLKSGRCVGFKSLLQVRADNRQSSLSAWIITHEEDVAVNIWTISLELFSPFARWETITTPDLFPEFSLDPLLMLFRYLSWIQHVCTVVYSYWRGKELGTF